MGRIPERGKMINSGPILAYFTLDKNSQPEDFSIRKTYDVLILGKT